MKGGCPDAEQKSEARQPFLTRPERRTCIDPKRAVHGHAYTYIAGDR